MTYHTNHSWCSKSCWEDEHFNAEVIVSFSEFLNNDYIKENDLDYKIADPDFVLLLEEKTFFDEESFNMRKEILIESGKVPLSDEDFLKKYKRFHTKKLKQISPKLIEWLNENVKDAKGSDENTPIANRKSWAIGNNSYSSENLDVNIFFTRQLDALAFIEKWSVFKEPTFYFDYFHDDRRDLNIKKIMDVVQYFEKNIQELTEKNKPFIDKYKKLDFSKQHFGSTDLNKNTFQLIDWEIDQEIEENSSDFEM